MDKSILFALFGLLLSACATAQSGEENQVKETIKAFSNAGDFNDVNTLENLLDNNYRIVMNQLFGSTEVAVVPKAVYLEKIKSKEWGGDSRDLTIENVLVNGNTASAKVTFKSEKMTFISILILIKNKEGQWKLISDLPVIS